MSPAAGIHTKDMDNADDDLSLTVGLIAQSGAVSFDSVLASYFSLILNPCLQSGSKEKLHRRERSSRTDNANLIQLLQRGKLWQPNNPIS